MAIFGRSLKSTSCRHHRNDNKIRSIIAMPRRESQWRPRLEYCSTKAADGIGIQMGNHPSLGVARRARWHSRRNCGEKSASDALGVNNYIDRSGEKYS